MDLALPLRRPEAATLAQMVTLSNVTLAQLVSVPTTGKCTRNTSSLATRNQRTSSMMMMSQRITLMAQWSKSRRRLEEIMEHCFIVRYDLRLNRDVYNCLSQDIPLLDA